MDMKVATPAAAASPVVSGHINKKLSLADFLNLDLTPKVDEPLTSKAVLDSFDSELRAYRPNPKEFFPSYKGRIIAGYRGLQYVLIRDVADRILFSQRTVSDSNKGKKCDFPIDFLADALFLEFKRDIDGSGDGALDVVDMGKGYFTSLDNRRLLIAKKIGAVDRTFGIWIRVHGYNDPLEFESLENRFKAKTWGEAVRVRIDNPAVSSGYSQNPAIKSWDARDRRVDAESQMILLSVDELDLSALHPADVVEINRRKVNGTIQI